MLLADCGVTTPAARKLLPPFASIARLATPAFSLRGAFVMVTWKMDDRRKIIVDETAPDFALPDTSGVPRRLSELTGNSLCVVLFYRGHW